MAILAERDVEPETGAAAWRLLEPGDTVCIGQVESLGVRQLLRRAREVRDQCAAPSIEKASSGEHSTVADVAAATCSSGYYCASTIGMEWLQLVYKVPAEPSRKRTYIWRQVRGLGAVYLQDACCVLPRTDAAEQALRQVAAKVREFGGEAMLSVLGPAEPGWEEHLMARLNRARDEEYEELLDTTERLEEEIARESRKDKFTFAALEEIEDGYDRLERWLERVRARDPFGAPGGRNADARLAQARARLEAFAEEVQGREHLDTGASEPVPPGGAGGERNVAPVAPKQPDVGGGDPSGNPTSG